MRRPDAAVGHAATSPRRRVRVLVVDDHEVVREGLTGALARAGYGVVCAVGTAAEALMRTRHGLPDVVLIDLRLPDATGIDLCRDLRDISASMALVVLTTQLSEASVRQAMHAGASAYMTKAEGLGALFAVIDHAVQLGGQRSDQIQTRLYELVEHRGEATDDITPQQANILELTAKGLTSRQVGAELFLAESTVRFHIQKLKRRFNAKSKPDLVANAIAAGAIRAGTEGEGLG